MSEYDIVKHMDEIIFFDADIMRARTAAYESGLKYDKESIVTHCNEAAANGRISADVVIRDKNLSILEEWLEDLGFQIATYPTSIPGEYCRINVNWSEDDKS